MDSNSNFHSDSNEAENFDCEDFEFSKKYVDKSSSGHLILIVRLFRFSLWFLACWLNF